MPGASGQRYDASGIVVACPLPLTLPPTGRSANEVSVVIAPPADVRFERPSPDLLAELGDDEHVYYSICRLADLDEVIRVHGLADIHISADGRRVRCSARNGIDPEYLAILLSGTVPAYLHHRQGATVLHASAATLGNRTVAILAGSAGGKTTLAAALCSVGATLLTDDVLVVDLDGRGDVRGRRGGTTLRLRAGAAALADRVPAAAAPRPTIDGRLDVEPASLATSAAPLDALLFPSIVSGTRTGAGVAITPLSPSETTFALAGAQRIQGTTAADQVARQFGAAGDLAERLPAYRLQLPAGAHLAPDFPARLAATCEEALARAGRGRGAQAAQLRR